MRIHSCVALAVSVALLCVACVVHSAPAETAAAPARVVVLVSAEAEWRIVRERFAAARVEQGPFGEWLVAALPGGATTFLHGGYGKVAAAASTQWAIDRFHPALLVNLGTCGGFAGQAQVGDVLLVRRTVIYDHACPRTL